MPSQSFVGSFVGNGFTSATPYVQSDIYTFTPAAGSTITPDTTPGTGNAVVVPAGYDSLAIYAGELPLNPNPSNTVNTVKVYYKVDGVLQTKPIELYTFQRVLLKVTAGQTIAFGTKTAPKNDPTTYSDTSVTVYAIPTKKNTARVAPSGIKATILPDQAPPNAWMPIGAHIQLADEHQTISVTPVSRNRDLFMYESKGDNLTPIRHIRIPAGEATKIDCRYQLLIFASLDGQPVEFTLPAGAQVLNPTGYKLEPEFTPSKTIVVSTPSEFKNAMNDASDNVEVKLNPGTYDLQASSSNWMTPTNYGTAMGKNRRISTVTGLNDVTFKVANPSSQGGQWHVVIFAVSTQITWIFKNITWDVAGIIKYSAGGTPKGAVDFALWNSSAVHTVDCKITGRYVSENVDATNGLNTSIKWRCITGSSTCFALRCDFRNATDDLTAANVEGGTAMTLHQVGCYLDGNGNRTDSQIITNHGGGVQVAWGCSFGNLTTGNQTLITSENESSPIYLQYCRSYVENYTGTVGVAVQGVGLANPAFLHFCDFPAFLSCDGLKSAIGCTFKTYSVGRPILYAWTTKTSKFIGCDFLGLSASTTHTGGERLVDCLSASVELFGSRLTNASLSSVVPNQGLLRMLHNGGASDCLATVTQCIFRSLAGTNAPALFELNSGSVKKQQMAIKNTIFTSDNAAATETISSSAANTSTIANSYFKQSGSPANYSTAFPSPSSVTFSTTAPALDANDVPTASGNVDYGTGTDIGVVGLCDINGRPIIGGSWYLGCAGPTSVVSGSILHLDTWA